jgi:hypothetical protein
MTMIDPTLLFVGFTSEVSPIAKFFRLESYQPQYEPAQPGVWITLAPRCNCEEAVSMMVFISSDFLRVADFGQFTEDLAVMLAMLSHDEDFMGLAVGPDPERPYYRIEPFAPDMDSPSKCDDTGCSWASTAYGDDVFEDVVDAAGEETTFELIDEIEDESDEDPESPH